MKNSEIENNYTYHTPKEGQPERYERIRYGGACWYYDYQGDVAKSQYCPRCGALMDGGDVTT